MNCYLQYSQQGSDGGTADNSTGDAAMDRVSATAVLYQNNKGVQTHERTSLLLKVRGAITAVFIQPWLTWETVEKRIQKAKAQRQLYNASAKSELAKEALKILDNEGNVDPHSLEKFVDQRVATKTKGLKTENQCLLAKIKTLEKGASSKTCRGAKGAPQGKRNHPIAQVATTISAKNAEKAGEEVNPTLQTAGEKEGRSNSKSNQKKKSAGSPSRKGRSTSRLTQK